MTIQDAPTVADRPEPAQAPAAEPARLAEVLVAGYAGLGSPGVTDA